jgi:hypothetical protein
MNPTVLVSSNDNIYVVDIVTGYRTPFLWEHVDQPPGYFQFLLDDPQQAHEVNRYGGDRDYYGITWVQDRIFVTKGEFPSMLVELNRSGKVVNRFLPPRIHTQIIRAHQITAAGDDVIITSTNNDTLFSFNTTYHTWSLFHLGTGGFSPIRHIDLLHPNSVRYTGNELHVVVYKQRQSIMIKFDYPSMKVKESIPVDVLTHCTWEMHGEHWHCASSDNKLVSHSGKAIQLDGWSRGVALSDEFLVVGAGKYGKREDRKKSSSSIWVFDAKTLVKVKEVPFEGSIRDIRFVNCEDHVHGQPTLFLG